jgi:hypothetical protein
VELGEADVDRGCDGLKARWTGVTRILREGFAASMANAI